MCTGFEPALEKFRSDSEAAGNPTEIVMVSSDRSAAEASKRAKALGMLQIEYDGSFRDALKLKFNVWSGSEQMKLGFGRRTGVPALVVLDSEGEEIAFVDAERSGPRALEKWPKDGQWP